MRIRDYKESLLPMIGLIVTVVLFNLSLGAAPVGALVLWDQPLSTVNQSAYVDQEFPDFPAYSSFLADDFENTVPWNISTIFVPGNFWNGGSTLANATFLSFQIYADAGGLPSGDPSGGGTPPVFVDALSPMDPQITLSLGSGGMPSDVTLNLASPLSLPAGDWWFIFFPTMEFGSFGQYGRQPSDTANGEVAQFINPGGGFGYGTAWQNWTNIGPTQQDIAFRLEGTTGTAPVPEPCTMLLVGSGLVGVAGLRRKVKA